MKTNVFPPGKTKFWIADRYISHLSSGKSTNVVRDVVADVVETGEEAKRLVDGRGIGVVS